MAARRQTGFTLIELMVAVIVLAILTAIATPSYVEYLERSRLKGAVEETLTLLAQARQGAVEADRNVKVRLTATVYGLVCRSDRADKSCRARRPGGDRPCSL